MKHSVPQFAVWAWLSLMVGVLPSVANANCVGWDKELPSYEPRYYSVSHEFRRAKYVIRAKVLRETWLGEDGKPKPLEPPFQNGSPKPWGLDPYVGAYYDLEVEESLKGAPPHLLRLFSENSTARFWMNVGTEWVLFVTDETFDDPIGVQPTIDTCSNTQPMPKAISVLRSVRNLARTDR